MYKRYLSSLIMLLGLNDSQVHQLKQKIRFIGYKYPLNYSGKGSYSHNKTKTNNIVPRF